MLSDKRLVRAIKEYREHPRVQNRHGPRSLDDLAYFMAQTGATKRPMAKGSLAWRLHRLVDRGLLGTGHSFGEDPRFFTAGLYVTSAGHRFLHEDVEDA